MALLVEIPRTGGLDSTCRLPRDSIFKRFVLDPRSVALLDVDLLICAH